MRTILSCTLALALSVASCSHDRSRELTPRQQRIADRITQAETLERFLTPVDRVTLTLPPGVYLDAMPRVRCAPDGYYLFNEMGKSIVVVSPRGNYLRSFGKPGSGPGEFRSMVTVAVDEEGSAYVVDNLLARLSVFSAAGACLRTMRVLNPYLIRHMCVTRDGLVFLHHAPDSLFPGYVSLYDKHGFTRSLLPGDPAYAAYFDRGHLDGNVVADHRGTVYETNTFSPYVMRIDTALGVQRLGEVFPGYRALPAQEHFAGIQDLQRAVGRSTVIRTLLLFSHESLLLQEVIFFAGPGEVIRRAANVYDTTGVLLGQLTCLGMSLNTSDGDRILALEPGMETAGDNTAQLPRLALYELREP